MALVVTQQLRPHLILPEAQVALVVAEDMLELAAQAIRHQQALAKEIMEGPVAMLQTVVRVVVVAQARWVLMALHQLVVTAVRVLQTASLEH